MKSKKLVLAAVPFLALSAYAQFSNKKDNAPKSFKADEPLEQVLKDAFGNRDHAGIQAIQQHNQANPSKPLRVWEGLYDFDAPKKPGDSAARTPWLQPALKLGTKSIQNFDISKSAHAQLFARVMQQYVYEGWFANKDNADEHFRQNSLRTWCSTPWMSDGRKGREAVHGLTKEFPMHPNPVYPAQGQLFTEETQPVSWGAAFFNRPACETYQEMFGTPENPRAEFERPIDNKDGFVSFKLLFSTLPGWENYEPWRGAYAWHAHVGPSMMDGNRTLRKIPHVQMDISMKDSRLRGTKAEVDHWIMLTYVYDPTYQDNELKATNLPAQLRHMRPVGIQFGFNPEDSIIFPGAKSNFRVGDRVIETGAGAVLNGPADNPRSSCLGCHGAAGLVDQIKETYGSVAATKFVDRANAWEFTFFDNEDFREISGRFGKGFSFNRQAELAYQRYQFWQQAKKKAAETGSPATPQPASR